MWIRSSSLLLVISLGLCIFAARKYRTDPEPVSPPPPAEESIETPSEERQKELNQFVDDWLKYMQGFEPNDMLNVVLPAGERRTFFLKVDHVPQILRGAYSVSEEYKNAIKMVIYDPNTVPLSTILAKRDHIFHFQVNITGEYRIEFTNTNVSHGCEMLILLVHVEGRD